MPLRKMLIITWNLRRKLRNWLNLWKLWKDLMNSLHNLFKNWNLSPQKWFKKKYPNAKNKFRKLTVKFKALQTFCPSLLDKELNLLWRKTINFQKWYKKVVVPLHNPHLIEKRAKNQYKQANLNISNGH